MHEYHSSPAREYKIEVKDRDMNQILVIGSLNMDVVVRMERLPALGETVLGEEYWNNPGGKGANQAYAARLAGGQVAMLGSVGTDKYGVRMLELLEKAGVQVMDIQRDSGQSTGTAFVLTLRMEATASWWSPAPTLPAHQSIWLKMQNSFLKPPACFCNWRFRWRACAAPSAKPRHWVSWSS